MNGGAFRKIWAIARLDLAVWRHSPWAMAAALVPPLAMAGLLAVLSLAVGRQPVALVIEGRGPQAQKMQRIIQSDEDAYIVKMADPATAQQLLKSQQVVGVITIPSGFDEAALHHKAAVKLELNNIDIDFSDDIRRALDLSVASFNSPLFGENVASDSTDDGTVITRYRSSQPAVGDDDDDDVVVVVVENPAVQQKLNPYRVAFNTRNARQTDVEFLHYQVMPVFILLILTTGIFGAAMLIARDFERGTAQLFRLAASPGVVLAGRILSGLVVITAVIVPLTGLAVWGKLIDPPAGHWPYLAAIFGLTSILATGAGCLLGYILRIAELTAIGAVIIATYLFFLGGGFTTIAFLPHWIQIISRFVPTSYAITGTRQALFYEDLGQIIMDIVWLALFALGSVVIGNWAVRRSFNKTEPKNLSD